MGFDCTLHVVDDRSFERFQARYLRGDRGDGAFDAAYPDADELIAKTKQLIASDLDRGGRALGELALMYVSTQTPHIYSRGFALSLWTKNEMGASLPSKFFAPVGDRLGEILQTRKVEIPDQFDQNYCVGRYVPAKDVAPLLAFVAKTLDKMAPGDRKPYAGLVTVLRVAAERGYSYWEGTDLGVKQAHAEWLEVPPPAGVRIEPSVLGAHPGVATVAGDRWSIHEHWIQHELDTSQFPPIVTTLVDTQYTAIAFTPWGTTFVRVTTDRTQRPYVFENLELPARTLLDIPYEPQEASVVGDAVVVWPFSLLHEGGRTGLIPVALRRVDGVTRVTPVELPAADLKVESLGCFTAPFGDGTWLLVWNQRAYRWDGAKPPALLGDQPLDAPDGLHTTATLSDHTIVGGFGRKLMRIDREGHRTPCLPLDNVMAVALGPDDALIIGEGDHPEADVLKIWWPASHDVTLVDGELLGLSDKPALFYYDAPRAQLVCASADKWHAIEWRALVALPRLSEADYAAKREKLVARRKKKK